LALSNYQIYHNCKETYPGLYFYATPFFQKSVNGARLGKYFTPECKSPLSVKEVAGGDINSLWLQLIGSAAPPAYFSSEVKIRAESQTGGVVFNGYVDFNKWFCDDCLEGTWGSVTTSVINIKNKLEIHEKVSVPGAGSFNDVQDALSYSGIKYSRFCGESNRWGLDDIQLKLGKNWFFGQLKDSHLGLYLVGTIPTGIKPKGRCLFEPIVGTKNGALGVGLNTDWTFYKECDVAVNWMIDVKYRYLFAADTHRTFDLCGAGSWSRYMPVLNFDTLNVDYAADKFTLPVNVQPGQQVECWTAFHVEWSNFNFEAGYNFWWRDREHVRLNKSAPINEGINNPPPAIGPETLSTATMSEAPYTVPVDANLTAAKPDLGSAAQPRAFINKIYGAFSYNDCWGSFVYEAGVGGGFEFANSAALENWSVFGKLGIGF
jgi:hypothetical protein